MKGSVAKAKYKLVLLGDQHVGKTALINRFINNTYDQSYNATIGIDFLVKNISYNDKHYRLQLWDTAGQQRFKSLIPSYLKDSSCSLIVYDVTNTRSLQNAFKWLELYNQHKNFKAVSILIGNKIDLTEGQEELRQNINALLQEKLKTSQLNHHLVSAKQGTGVNQAFQSIVNQLDNHHKAIAIKPQIQDTQKQEKQIKTAQALIRQTDNKFHLEQKMQSIPTKKNCCL